VRTDPLNLSRRRINDNKLKELKILTGQIIKVHGQQLDQQFDRLSLNQDALSPHVAIGRAWPDYNLDLLGITLLHMSFPH
jgi:hypothetical protein